MEHSGASNDLSSTFTNTFDDSLTLQMGQSLQPSNTLVNTKTLTSSETQNMLSAQPSCNDSTSSLPTASASEMGKSLETKLDTFIYFNKLPAELRVKIWKYLLPGPRIVPVAFDIRGHGLLSTAKPPTLLRVSREARLEAQREYPPAFAIDGVSTIVPFNFELDTMLILPPDFRDQRFSKSVLDYYSRLPLQDRSKVRSLALDCQDAFYCETLTQQAGKFFPKISTLVLLRCSRSTKNCSCNPPCLRWRSTMVTTTTNPYNFSQLATINRFKLAWTKANGGQNDLSFPRVETGVLMMSCTKISPGDCTILPQYLGRKTGNPRRSGRSGIKKDYNEIKLGY